MRKSILTPKHQCLPRKKKKAWTKLAKSKPMYYILTESESLGKLFKRCDDTKFLDYLTTKNLPE